MRVAVDDGEVAARAVARTEARARIDEPLVQCTALGRQPISKLVGELCVALGETLQVGRRGVVAGPFADRIAQARIVPPGRVKPRPRRDDALALRRARRQGPDGGDRMRLGEVLQQQVPRVGGLLPGGLMAARNCAPRHRRGDLVVEGDLVAAGVPRRVGPVRQARLEYEGVGRSRRRALIGQAQPDDVRQHSRARAFDRHRGDAAVPQRARPAQRIGEMADVRSDFRQRRRGHGASYAGARLCTIAAPMTRGAGQAARAQAPSALLRLGLAEALTRTICQPWRSSTWVTARSNVSR